MIEAAVIGVPDNILGQAVVAFVVLDGQPKMDEQAIISFCSQRLEKHMVPKNALFLVRYYLRHQPEKYKNQNFIFRNKDKAMKFNQNSLVIDCNATATIISSFIAEQVKALKRDRDCHRDEWRGRFVPLRTPMC